MAKICIGYHYTSLNCWSKIQKQGLLPYSIRKPQLYEHFGTDTVEGVWVWKEKLIGLSHIGCLLYQIAHKGALKVVVLEVDYNWDDILSPPGDPNFHILLHHQGTIENLEYHKGDDTAYIITTRIPPENIRLLGIYSLLDAWKEEK
jgi:hypothetical protein